MMPSSALSHDRATTADVPPKARVVAKTSPDKLTYALTSFTAERRTGGWFVAQSYSPYYDEKPKWRGPFESIDTAILSIARQLASELADRHTRDIERHKILRGSALYGLQAGLKLDRGSSRHRSKGKA
jgi:hypothetical protein